MNERIRELRKLAERYTLDIPASLEPHEFDEIFDETFAELIVRECMSYMKDGDIDFAKFMIKRNFGVEE